MPTERVNSVCLSLHEVETTVRGVLAAWRVFPVFLSGSDSAIWQTLNLLGLTDLLGKIEFKLLHFVVLWMSKG